MKKLILLFAASIALSLPATAQKTVSLAELQKSSASLKNNKQYRFVYAKAADRSLVFSNLPAAQRGTFAPSETVIPLNVGFDFRGNSFAGPRDEFVVFFHSLGRRWNFLKDETLAAIADGQRIELGRRETDNAFRDVFLNGKLTRESLVFRIDRRDLEKMAGARKVEVKLSDLVYRLEAGDLECLKNLLAMAALES